MRPELMNIGLLVVLVVAAYFLFIRPARQRQKEQAAKLAAIVAGDRVMTSIGIYGNVKHLGENQAIIEIAPAVEITIAKQILMKVVDPSEEEFEYADENPTEDEENRDDK